MKTIRPLPLVGVLALALTACTSGGAAAPSAPPASSPTTTPPASDPGDTGVIGGGGGQPAPGGQAKLVRIFPNAIDPHDVSVTRIVPAVNGRKLAVQLEWWSGVEPCDVLAGVMVDKQGSTIKLTVREGIGDRNAMCIEIATLKAFIVDVGELEPGTYTITAAGDAQPVEVTIG